MACWRLGRPAGTLVPTSRPSGWNFCSKSMLYYRRSTKITASESSFKSWLLSRMSPHSSGFAPRRRRSRKLLVILYLLLKKSIQVWITKTFYYSCKSGDRRTYLVVCMCAAASTSDALIHTQYKTIQK